MTLPKILSRTPPSAVSAATIVTSRLTLQPQGLGFVDITHEVAAFVDEIGAKEGAVTLFIRHTSASLTIQENADPSVLADLSTVLANIAPEQAKWTHEAECPDDMPAHLRSAVTCSSVSIPVTKGSLALGTWQALYLWEHRAAPHRRRLVVTVTGTGG